MLGFLGNVLLNIFIKKSDIEKNVDEFCTF